MPGDNLSGRPPERGMSVVKRGPIRACLAVLCLAVAAAAHAQQIRIAADTYTNARPFVGQPGRHLTFVCAGNVNWSQQIWGTDVYTDSSPICTAAVHAGVFKPGKPGLVTIVIGGKAPSFQSTTRNGAASLSYGAWHTTYTFSRTGEPGTIDWYTTEALIDPDFQDPITVICPPGGKLTAAVWGTDVYTYSSAICIAAVHAGAIRLDAGGRVTVTRLPKQGSFVASVRNGVSTLAWAGSNWASYLQPYKVTPGAVDIIVPTSPGARSGPLPTNTNLSRTIALAGITAQGTSTPVAPRTIRLAGIAARGTSTSVAPRTIAIAGIIAKGSSAPVTPRTISVGALAAKGAFPVVASRTVTLAGFSGSGAAPVVASRTITLAGFTGSGSTTVRSRTITLAGFAGSGSTIVRSRTITLIGWTGQGFKSIQ